jgi:hypothetical protein
MLTGALWTASPDGDGTSRNAHPPLTKGRPMQTSDSNTGAPLSASQNRSLSTRPPTPRLERRGGALQLIVDDAPYLVLGGELHNSSPSSPAYMEAVWERLGAAGLRTVISPVTWQLVEPVEGQFDFTTLDDQLAQAQKHGIRIVLLWFGSYKNADSAYAPSWVRRDESRFPRATRDPQRLQTGQFTLDAPVLSVFGENLVAADARAFAALMRHLREVDEERTVIMVQVQNEVGLLGDSRDRSAAADTAWSSPVPSQLMSGLMERGDSIRDHVRQVWSRNGSRTSGTWEEVFGAGPEAEEIFMSWAFARFVETVAAAGSAEYPLPMFTNAWLGPQPNADTPGQYPSGGPVARMMDIWKVGAPTLALLAPDIYVDDFAGTLTDFTAPDNAVLVPEAIPRPGLPCVAIGGFRALGFSPFAIEELPVDHDVFRTYRVLESASQLILDAQAEDRLHGFQIRTGEQQTASIGGFEITINGPLDTRGMFGAGTGEAAQELVGYGLIIRTGSNDFLGIVRGASLRFSRTDSEVELDRVEEGLFRNGSWVPGRILNGDERYFMFPNDDLRLVRITLLRRAP